MTLIDKIQEAHSNKLSDYSTIYTPTAEVIEQIADDYAVEFGEYLDSLTTEDMGNLSIKEILEIFKKEKEL